MLKSEWNLTKKQRQWRPWCVFLFILFFPEVQKLYLLTYCSVLDRISPAVAVKVHRTDTLKTFADTEFSCDRCWIRKSCTKMLASHYQCSTGGPFCFCCLDIKDNIFFPQEIYLKLWLKDQLRIPQLTKNRKFTNYFAHGNLGCRRLRKAKQKRVSLNKNWNQIHDF